MSEGEVKLNAWSVLTAAIRDGDCLVFASLFILSLAFIFIAIPLGVDLPSDAPGLWFDPDSPRFITYLSGGAICVLSVMGFVKALHASDLATGNTPFTSRLSKRELGALLQLGFSLPLIPLFGLPLAGGLVGVGLLVLSGSRRFIFYPLVGLAMPVLIWAFFDKLLNVPVPSGPF